MNYLLNLKGHIRGVASLNVMILSPNKTEYFIRITLLEKRFISCKISHRQDITHPSDPFMTLLGAQGDRGGQQEIKT